MTARLWLAMVVLAAVMEAAGVPSVLAAPDPTEAAPLAAPAGQVMAPAGAPAASPFPAEVVFLVGSQSLVLRLPPHVVPTLHVLRRIPRVVVDLPNTVLAPGKLAFTAGKVASYTVENVGTGSRIVLFLRTPLRAAPLQAYYAGRVVISLESTLPPLNEVVPINQPSVFASPRERPIPIPTTVTPSSRITPVPIPSHSGPLPVPREIPPIHQGMLCPGKARLEETV